MWILYFAKKLHFNRHCSDRAGSCTRASSLVWRDFVVPHLFWEYLGTFGMDRSLCWISMREVQSWCCPEELSPILSCMRVLMWTRSSWWITIIRAEDVWFQTRCLIHSALQSDISTGADPTTVRALLFSLSFHAHGFVRMSMCSCPWAQLTNVTVFSFCFNDGILFYMCQSFISWHLNPAGWPTYTRAHTLARIHWLHGTERDWHARLLSKNIRDDVLFTSSLRVSIVARWFRIVALRSSYLWMLKALKTSSYKSCLW